MRNVFKVFLLLVSFFGLYCLGDLALQYETLGYGLHPMVAFFGQCAMLFCTATLFNILE